MIRLDIHNDGTGTEEIGNYDVYLWLPGEHHSARVENHVRSDGWEVLVHRAVFALSSSCKAKIEEPEPTPLPPSHDK